MICPTPTLTKPHGHHLMRFGALLFKQNILLKTFFFGGGGSIVIKYHVHSYIMGQNNVQRRKPICKNGLCSILARKGFPTQINCCTPAKLLLKKSHIMFLYQLQINYPIFFSSSITSTLNTIHNHNKSSQRISVTAWWRSPRERQSFHGIGYRDADRSWLWGVMQSKRPSTPSSLGCATRNLYENTMNVIFFLANFVIAL